MKSIPDDKPRNAGIGHAVFAMPDINHKSRWIFNRKNANPLGAETAAIQATTFSKSQVATSRSKTGKPTSLLRFAMVGKPSRCILAGRNLIINQPHSPEKAKAPAKSSP